ncbi:hypothetical protein DSQ20_05775 [Nitrosarchaeum sp. AC2]|nr:hypothetical protein DSQ20_05775 [Nitrosarchaeum sp. AC2]
MAPRCKGQCVDLKTKRFDRGLKYQNGIKWCTVCSHFIQTEFIRCICCNTKLRVRAKHRVEQNQTHV